MIGVFSQLSNKNIILLDIWRGTRSDVRCTKTFLKTILIEV